MSVSVCVCVCVCIGIQKESKETLMLRQSFNSYDDDGSGFIGNLILT